MALGKSAKKGFYRLVLAIIILLLCMLYYQYDPTQTECFPKCPLYGLWGIKCPGCGSQRMFHSLLHLHIAEAARHNLLFVLLIPILLFTIFSRVFKQQFPYLFNITVHPAYSTFIVITICLWWILRNVFNW